MRYKRPDPDELRRLYQHEHLTVAEIAGILDVAHGTAHNWLRDAGITLRQSPSTARGDLSDQQISDLYLRDGPSAPEIAARFGC